MGVLDYILLTSATIFSLWAIHYASSKAAKDRQRARNKSAPLESNAFSSMSPEMTRRYRFYTTKENLRWAHFVVEDDAGAFVIKASKSAWGEGISLGDLLLSVRRYRPGQKLRNAGGVAKFFETELTLPDGSLWSHLVASSRQGCKAYAFALDGDQYSLEWNAKSGFWGAAGLSAWPATLYLNGEPAAQAVRADSSLLASDFSNLVYIASRERIKPQILAFVGIICCADFFGRREIGCLR